MKNTTIFFALILGFFLFNGCEKNQPTCTDGIRNGNETGTDCGGDCYLTCGATTVNPPAPVTAPCSASAPLNGFYANSNLVALPYVSYTFSSPYYVLLRSSAGGTGSTHYVYIHFYGAPPTIARTYTTTGSASYPTNVNQVRLRMKYNGAWYYPPGTVYYNPVGGNFSVYICGLQATYTFTSRVNSY